MGEETTAIGKGATSHRGVAATESFVGAHPPGPQRIGRYRLQRLLGAGGFGRVFLGFDEELRRQVAIKMPTPERFQEPEDAEQYLAEARMVAGLDHPNIVPVHDVGRTDDGTIYVVSKFIEGRTLHERLLKDRPEHAEAAKLLATIALALDHAHRQRLVHRDVKPANILIEDASGTAYIADFGLAIREDDFVATSEVSGTPAYMSPEQARGEGHRLDGRSDIFSLGVVFYEMLTGQRPFWGGERSDILHDLVFVEPYEPRALDESVPAELERICLKAISKRAADRYPTAAQLAEDLLDWQQGQQPQRQERTIVPKGLRSFDAGDADFFLDLLPGPRDRTGLPESLNFWKARIEERDGDQTFNVGLIYGPSGCGKSSLVKAGLLPRLSKDVKAIYVEATATETEARILRELRKQLPDLRTERGLVETFMWLRRGDGPKVVVVLDQFEQWLHAHRAEEETALVSALRQCDGGRLQAVVMVRDDFSMAASRFMRKLETPIVEGRNFATVDLFDVDHAQKVLIKFGQAFGKLPLQSGKLSEAELAFVRSAANDLARDGKVVSVRLALFAEMVKNKPWIPETLQELGGTEGIGAKFLEEKFDSRDANPEHRQHQGAARDILQALLPEVGTDIKGHMRSVAELMAAVRRDDRPGDFNDLFRILDSELRLITPTDPASTQSPAAGDVSGTFYQLTHDYLVPSLRQWLTHKQKETRRGRAELRLAERAAFWSVKPENRHLPSAWEFGSILALTGRERWNESQQRMMAKAGRVHGMRALATVLLVTAVAAAAIAFRTRLIDRQNRALANGLVDQLLVADVGELADIAEAAKEQSDLTVPRLAAIADDSRRTQGERLRATYALADEPGERASRLIGYALAADLATLQTIRQRLAPLGPGLARELWQTVRQGALAPAAQLRIGTLLAVADPGGAEWESIAPLVVNALLSENTLDLDAWAEMLRPAAHAITPVLRDRFFDSSATPTERETAARVLARYADAPLLAELLLEADAAQYAKLLPGASRQQEEMVRAMLAAVRLGAEAAAGARASGTRRRRNAAVTLLRLAPKEAEQFLVASSDNTVRTTLIAQLREFGVPPEVLIKALGDWRDPGARQALLLALGPYRSHELSPETQQRAVDAALAQFRSSPHQAERSAARWLLEQWKRDQPVAELVELLAQKPPPTPDELHGRDWWINSQRQPMLVVEGPVTFSMGSPENESRREDVPARVTSIPYSFAIGVNEVTIEQYRRFQPDADFAEDVGGDWPRSPANQVSIQKAMQYCRWLSEQEGVPEDQMCYGPISDSEPGDTGLSDERLRRTGYRLPTEAEWEYAYRAGSTTPWFAGASDEHLGYFAWIAVNSGGRMRPAGTLWPNAHGMFDMAGNVTEWCHSPGSDVRSVYRGGYFNDTSKDARAATRWTQSARAYSYNGFRIARTMGPGR